MVLPPPQSLSKKERGTCCRVIAGKTSCPTVTRGRKTTDANFFRLTVWVYSFLMPAQYTGLPEVALSLPKRAQELSPFALDKSQAKVSLLRRFQDSLA